MKSSSKPQLPLCIQVKQTSPFSLYLTELGSVGGADTVCSDSMCKSETLLTRLQTPSSLASFILAMVLHPEIQARAQAEIDSVVGPEWQRLPSFADRPRLPYVDAIVLELLRWNTSVPLGLCSVYL